jgi:hypothetical protein
MSPVGPAALPRRNSHSQPVGAQARHEAPLNDAIRTSVPRRWPPRLDARSSSRDFSTRVAWRAPERVHRLRAWALDVAKASTAAGPQQHGRTIRR